MTDAILIVGADGLLGSALHRHWQARGVRVHVAGLTPPDPPPGWLHLDLTQPAEAWPTLPPCRAAVLCAAITRLEQCRSDPEGTRRINVHQTLVLARRLITQGSFVVFPSSNLVFDGSRPAFPADAACSPRTEYGRQKAETEAGLAQSDPGQFAVVRLTKVFHPHMPLLRGWVDHLAAGRAIAPWTDLRCAPIELGATVRALARITENRLHGLWQFSPASDSSYAALAAMLARLLPADASLVQPTTGANLAPIEHLPRHTTLDAARASRELDLHFPDAERVIASCLFHAH